MPTFLHVGSGYKRKDQTTPEFGRDEWSEIRLDIDPGVAPDIVSDMCDMSAVASGSVDAVFSSHNIEHLFIHQVPIALQEFRRVLKPNGFLVLLCPDLQAAAALIAEDKLHEPAYQSRAGGITPHDMLYGYGRQIEAGHHFMAHRCGFTAKSLSEALRAAGFSGAAVRRRALDLKVVAVQQPTPGEELRAMLDAHFGMKQAA